MLNRFADAVRLRAFADSQVQPVRAAGSVSPRDFTIGDQVRAHVKSVLPGDVFRVLIEDQPYLLRLPVSARSGDVIRLTVAAVEPRLRFALDAQPTLSAQTTRLSDTARFITALLRESEKLPLSNATHSGKALLAHPPESAAHLAGALSNAMMESGIFYESHQAQWVAGERPLKTLLNEPQARLPRAPGAASTAALLQAGDADPATSMPELPVHRDALPIVKQQLETLDTRHVLWQGLIWPDQPMEWHIARQPPDAGTDSAQSPWLTRISLTLPQLGTVGAALHVDHRGVTISLDAALPATAAALGAGLDSLLQSLRGADVNALSAAVRTHATP